MPYGPRRGHSDYLQGRHVRELRAATAHADVIGKPLRVRVHINWNRTTIGDDHDGRLLATFRHRAARWLRERDVGFYAIAVRERPGKSTPRPNVHMHLHVPPELVEQFRKAAPSFLPRGVDIIDERALRVDTIRPTKAAQEGALAYICKGVAPKAGQLLGIKPERQGRVYGKRCIVSVSLGPAARRSCAQVSDQQPRSGEPRTQPILASSRPLGSPWTGKATWWEAGSRRA